MTKEVHMKACHRRTLDTLQHVKCFAATSKCTLTLAVCITIIGAVCIKMTPTCLLSRAQAKRLCIDGALRGRSFQSFHTRKFPQPKIS